MLLLEIAVAASATVEVEWVIVEIETRDVQIIYGKCRGRECSCMTLDSLVGAYGGG